jgi:hypothetical protein
MLSGIFFCGLEDVWKAARYIDSIVICHTKINSSNRFIFRKIYKFNIFRQLFYIMIILDLYLRR